MPITSVDINDLASVGVVRDQASFEVAPEGWTTADNMRAFAAGMERLKGREGTLGTNPRTSGQAPHFIMHVSSVAQPWWLWSSLTKIFVYNGSVDTDISRSAGGAYAATAAKDWTGTILGGIPILTSRNDVPQFWNAYSIATNMANLTNWPASTFARVIRAFGPYLLALNLTETSVNKPHRVKWSSSADPGSLPSTWDETDTTSDSGEVDLADTNSGIILDGLGLQGQFYIYKENSIWRVQFIGGTFIFNFQTFSETAGLLATRCVALTGDGLTHVFASQDDILYHNGTTMTSLLDKKMKRTLFNAIDTSNFDASFMFCHPLQDEMWFCYPEQGNTQPNRAVIWNYRYNVITEADVSSLVAASIGTVSTASGAIWSALTETWEEDVDSWFAAARRKVVVADSVSKKLLALDAGATYDGTEFTGTLQRVGLSLVGRKRNGEWIVDYQQRKQINRLWPKVTEGIIQIRVGYQDTVNGTVAWRPYQTFDPSADMFIDGVLGSGRAVAVEFSAANDFHIEGYKLDMPLTGKF